MKTLEKYILRTPLIPFRGDAGSARIFLKPENLQIFGSYKIRGVASVVRHADPSVLAKGLVTVSAGNMAQAVAFAAKQLRFPCRVYLPDAAPAAKKDAIAALDATIVERPFSEIWQMVRGDLRLVDKGIFIHPAFTDSLLRGYGEIVDEIVGDHSEIDALVVPFGVGGLSLGIARRLRAAFPNVSLILAEPETAAPMSVSLRLGRATSIDRRASFVDAIGTPEVLARVFDELAPIISGVVVVSLVEAEDALRLAFKKHRLVLEGAAACALAAAQKVSAEGRYNNIVCLLSGGNIDPESFGQLINQ